MKFKKLLASSLLCGLCIFSSIPVHASEVEGPDTGIQRTEAALTDGVTRAYIHAFSAFCPIEPSGKKMELNNVCILYLFL